MHAELGEAQHANKTHVAGPAAYCDSLKATQQTLTLLPTLVISALVAISIKGGGAAWVPWTKRVMRGMTTPPPSKASRQDCMACALAVYPEACKVLRAFKRVTACVQFAQSVQSLPA